MFRLILLSASYYSFQQFNETADQKLPVSEVLNFLSIFPPVVLLIEAVCYLVFRKRYFLRRLVRLHIWMTIISSVLFPIFETLFFVFILAPNYTGTDLTKITDTYYYSILIAGWLLFALARFLFIVAFVKSTSSVKDQVVVSESTGLLNEFSNKQ